VQFQKVAKMSDFDHKSPSQGCGVCESSEAEAESNIDDSEGQHTRPRVGVVARFLIVWTQSRSVVLMFEDARGRARLRV